MSHRTFADPTSIEARQSLLDGRCERAHPKRHRTAKRKSRAQAAKALAGKRKAALNAVAARRRQAIALAYWRGEREDLHP